MPLAEIMPALTGALIDRADAVRADPERLAALMDWRARLLRLDALDSAIDAEGRLVWHSLADAAADSELIFLGLDQGKACFAELKVDERGSMVAYNPRLWAALAALPGEELALYGAARSLVDWHGRHRFCARCGGATILAKGGWARRCEQCAAEHFPRVDPVVIMLAEHDGQVLLGRQPRFPPRRFSALAGFVEPGESIEEAVARELFEEAGIRVADVRYVASQPWPFPSSLMVAAWCRADDPALTIDQTELDEAHWFDRDAVAAALAGDPDAPFIAPPPFAIAHDLLRWWHARQG